MRELKFMCYYDNGTSPKMIPFDLTEEDLDVPKMIRQNRPIVQFVGVKDMDGNDVYEHDIIDIIDLSTQKVRGRKVVTYNPNSFRYVGIPHTHYFRIVGNVHTGVN